MTSKQLHSALLGGIALLLIGLVAGVYGINSMLTKDAVKLTTMKAESQALTQEQASLRNAKKSIERYAELEKIAKAVVPEDKNQAATVREIANMAAEHGIKLGAVTFPASTLGANVPAAGANSAKPAPVVVNDKAAALSQLQPVKTIPNVYQLTITVTGDPKQPVSYNDFIAFLDSLEHNRRTAQVSSITLQPDTKNRNLLTFTLTLNQYVKKAKS